MRAHPVLLAYLLAVTLLAATAYTVIATTEDGSIGGGFALFLLMGAALPWSLLVSAVFDSISNLVPMAILWSLAVTNGACVALWQRRVRKDDPSQAER